jgi:hypothetical protein
MSGLVGVVVVGGGVTVVLLSLPPQATNVVVIKVARATFVKEVVKTLTKGLLFSEVIIFSKTVRIYSKVVKGKHSVLTDKSLSTI